MSDPLSFHTLSPSLEILQRHGDFFRNQRKREIEIRYLSVLNKTDLLNLKSSPRRSSNRGDLAFLIAESLPTISDISIRLYVQAARYCEDSESVKQAILELKKAIIGKNIQIFNIDPKAVVQAYCEIISAKKATNKNINELKLIYKNGMHYSSYFFYPNTIRAQIIEELQEEEKLSELRDNTSSTIILFDDSSDTEDQKPAEGELERKGKSSLEPFSFYKFDIGEKGQPSTTYEDAFSSNSNIFYDELDTDIDSDSDSDSEPEPDTNLTQKLKLVGRKSFYDQEIITKRTLLLTTRNKIRKWVENAYVDGDLLFYEKHSQDIIDVRDDTPGLVFSRFDATTKRFLYKWTLTGKNNTISLNNMAL